jgi:hypothetical protein
MKSAPQSRSLNGDGQERGLSVFSVLEAIAPFRSPEELQCLLLPGLESVMPPEAGRPGFRRLPLRTEISPRKDAAQPQSPRVQPRSRAPECRKITVQPQRKVAQPLIASIKSRRSAAQPRMAVVWLEANLLTVAMKRRLPHRNDSYATCLGRTVHTRSIGLTPKTDLGPWSRVYNAIVSR